MPRMSATETKMWKSRLFEHATAVWRERGYYDDSPSERQVRRHMEAYKGNQWGFDLGTWDQVESDLVTDNVFFSTVNVLVSSLFARHPVVDVMASGHEYQANASRQERLVNHLVQTPKLKIKRELNKALLDAVLTPWGVIRHGFTPASEKVDKDGHLIEYYDPAKPDFPWIRRVPPWDFLCDPLADTFEPDGDARWCAFRTLAFLEDVKRNPGLIARQDLRPTRRIDVQRLTRAHRKEERSEESNELVELWTVFDKVERKWFTLSPGSDSTLREPDDWPIPTWQSLPFNLLQFNPSPADPFGVAYSELVLPLQVEINKALTIANRLIQSIRRPIFYQKGLLGDGEEAKLETLGLLEFVAVDGNPRDAVLQTQLGGLPQELLFHIRFLIEQIRNTIGVSEMERANRVNVETASEVNQIAAGSQAQRGRNQGPWEDFLSDTFTTFGLSLQFSITDEITVPIVGESDAASLYGDRQGNPFETVTPENIQGEFLYRVRPGSTLPRDPNEDIRRELALNQALAQFGEVVALPQRAVDTVLAFDKDPSRQLATPELMRERQKVAQQQGVPPNAEVDTGGIPPNLAGLLQGNGAARGQ